MGRPGQGNRAGRRLGRAARASLGAEPGAAAEALVAVRFTAGHEVQSVRSSDAALEILREWPIGDGRMVSVLMRNEPGAGRQSAKLQIYTADSSKVPVIEVPALPAAVSGFVCAATAQSRRSVGRRVARDARRADRGSHVVPGMSRRSVSRVGTAGGGIGGGGTDYTHDLEAARERRSGSAALERARADHRRSA